MTNLEKLNVAEVKAMELGAKKISYGINWTWAEDFDTQDEAQDFVEWLDEKGYDHRGVYDGFSVRFRVQ